MIEKKWLNAIEHQETGVSRTNSTWLFKSKSGVVWFKHFQEEDYIIETAHDEDFYCEKTHGPGIDDLVYYHKIKVYQPL